VTSLPRDAPQFFLTTPARCPYLPDRLERKVFIHLTGGRARELHDVLSQGGFRRSQTIAYRPACDTCHSCISVRIPVNDFHLGKTMRKTERQNKDLVSNIIPNKATSEHYALFRSYIDQRHPVGGMVNMSMLDFTMMVEESHVTTQLMEIRPHGPDTAIHGKGQGPLMACGLSDVLCDGISMVYSWYDPDCLDRSIGTELILRHIALTKALGLPYLYLGYWIPGSPKMAYKARFFPHERLMPEGWVRIRKELKA
jgi:leucyl-tRNA---protein transferase